jgi:hypothetical protein
MVGWSDALRVANTVVFRNSLQNCACNNDKKYTKQFYQFYAILIERKIVLEMNNFYVFNHSDHFVKNKYQELESLLKISDFKECTKTQILEFYKSKTTGMIMNVANKHGGRKTRKKKSRQKKRKDLL